MKVLTDSPSDQQQSKWHLPTAATGVSDIETAVSYLVLSSMLPPAVMPGTEHGNTVNWRRCVDRWLDKTTGPRDNWPTEHVNPWRMWRFWEKGRDFNRGQTQKSIAVEAGQKIRSANVLLRCYRHRPFNTEFVTFCKRFLITGFQTPLDSLKVHGLGPLPSNLFITPFCSPDILSKSVYDRLFFSVRPSDIFFALVCCVRADFPSVFRAPSALRHVLWNVPCRVFSLVIFVCIDSVFTHL